MQLTENKNPLIATIISDLANPNLSKDEWFAIHAKCVAAKHLGSKLVKYSRERATTEWGVVFVADSEVQIEMDLGVDFAEEKPALNAEDKWTRIVTIEATHASFLVWDRKMADEVQTWDAIKLRRVLELLEPMEKKAIELRALIYMQEATK
jgi:hypothetical protein